MEILKDSIIEKLENKILKYHFEPKKNLSLHEFNLYIKEAEYVVVRDSDMNGVLLCTTLDKSTYVCVLAIFGENKPSKYIQLSVNGDKELFLGTCCLANVYFSKSSIHIKCFDIIQYKGQLIHQELYSKRYNRLQNLIIQNHKFERIELFFYKHKNSIYDVFCTVDKIHNNFFFKQKKNYKDKKSFFIKKKTNNYFVEVFCNE